MMWRLFEKMIALAKVIAAELKSAKTAVQKSFNAVKPTKGPQDKIHQNGRAL